MSQPSLFDNDTLPETALPMPTHDIEQLKKMIVLIDGEGRILDANLGAWLGYRRVEKIRELIRRHWRELVALGSLPQRGVNPGSKGGRPTFAYYLNQAQVNHLIIFCGLPDLSETRVLVTKVFTEWQNKNLASTNAETTIELQDAVEAAERQKPGSTQLGKLAERVERLEADVSDTKRTATEAWSDAKHALKLVQSPPLKYPKPSAPIDPNWPTASGLPRLVEPRKE
jgi:hypothetical protein